MAATKEKQIDRAAQKAQLEDPVVAALVKAVKDSGGDANPAPGGGYVALRKNGRRLGWVSRRRKYAVLDHLADEVEKALPKKVVVKPSVAHIDENSVAKVAEALKAVSPERTARATAKLVNSKKATPARARAGSRSNRAENA